MSTTEKPAESSSGGGGEGGAYRFQPVAGARMPIPGNAEFLFFLALEAFLAILLLDDAWDANDWAFASTILGVGYLISRGIAKASRVLEH